MPDPGDVIWMDFPGANGIKRRPAVIVSTQAYHAARPDVIVGLVTSQISRANSPTDHLITDWAAAGLKVQSVFRCFFATVPRGSILSVAGKLTSNDWLAVQVRMRTALEV